MADTARFSREPGSSGRPTGREPGAPARRRQGGGTPRLQRGGTILGFMAGLIFGLVVAVFVAIFVTRAPVPFVNRVGKGPDKIVEPKTPAEAPDPNKPLYSKQRPASGGTDSAPVAVAPTTAPVPPPNTAGGDAAKASGDAAKSGDGKDDKTSYLLQAGAFRSQDDADGMKAKLALIGFEAKVLTAEVNGQTLYRVRVGPYAQLDDMNRVRAKLAESGIEASVVRQR
jgi:cell division protein FtsN